MTDSGNRSTVPALAAAAAIVASTAMPDDRHVMSGTF